MLLLQRHATKVNPQEVMRLIPASTPLATLMPFLQQVCVKLVGHESCRWPYLVVGVCCRMWSPFLCCSGHPNLGAPCA